MYQNHETHWQIAKLERSRDIAHAERLAGLGWSPELTPRWLKRLAASITRQRSVQPFDREEARPRQVARGL